TIWILTRIVCLGMRPSPFSHSQVSDHPVLITMSDGVGFHHGWTVQELWSLAWGCRLLFSIPMLVG
ncbi:hypothetical protein Tco_0457432, partial [Tanacetum coccineum]